jgi:glutathione S-transferase
MSIEIYWASGSPFAWRALLALEQKGLPYTSHLLQFSKGDHKTPGYLEMNPRGKVPVLKDGDLVLYESLAIMAYLDRQYPDPPLFGSDARRAAAVWQRVAEQLSYVDSLLPKVVLPIFFNRVAEEKASIEGASELVLEELARLERDLGDGRTWLCGEAVTAADLVTLTEVELFLRAASRDAALPLKLAFTPLGEKLPRLAAWLDRFRALPAYERTYPPHWKG